jgi:hypothetical protein
MKSVRIALLAVLLLTQFSLPAQEKVLLHETTARVPELDEFHTVIAKIWHDAWPTKDTAMLIQLLPTIQKGAAAVTRAELPGILREKKGAWESGVKNLNQTLAEYETAVKAGDGDRLLAAAERLHMRYEGLVRAIRPALKELDDFHAALYMLYHYYSPQSDLPKAREATAQLTVRMATLEKAKLPQRLAGKAESFDRARQQLAEAVAALDRTVKTDSEEKLKQSLRSAVDGVHGKYVALEKIFE